MFQVQTFSNVSRKALTKEVNEWFKKNKVIPYFEPKWFYHIKKNKWYCIIWFETFGIKGMEFEDALKKVWGRE